jgi:hypothetical protein
MVGSTLFLIASSPLMLGVMIALRSDPLFSVSASFLTLTDNLRLNPFWIVGFNGGPFRSVSFGAFLTLPEMTVSHLRMNVEIRNGLLDEAFKAGFHGLHEW